jgi:hypothetical protein
MKQSKHIYYLLVLLIYGRGHILVAQNNLVVTQRLSEIRAGLDSLIFVKRFESIESPCVCIDEKDHRKADPKRKLINSDYQLGLYNRHHIDSGVRCLSQFYARYTRFKIETIDTGAQTMKGIVELTYGYPASSIIQFLGMYHQKSGPTNVYFNQLLKNTGRFALYTEKDKYRIWVVLDDGPYHNLDTAYGYLEIVKNGVGPDGIKSYGVYFDQISYDRGDKNNQIFLKYTSTSFDLETQYYSRLLFEDLKSINSTDMIKKANAVWLKSFYNNPRCESCSFVYDIAEKMVKDNLFSLPNTNPIPAH